MSTGRDERQSRTEADEDPSTTARREIRTHRTQVREQELGRALSTLDPNPRQAVVLALLSHRLVRRLTATPLRTLEAAEDPVLGETALALFERDNDTAG